MTDATGELTAFAEELSRELDARAVCFTADAGLVLAGYGRDVDLDALAALAPCNAAERRRHPGLVGRATADSWMHAAELPVPGGVKLYVATAGGVPPDPETIAPIVGRLMS